MSLCDVTNWFMKGKANMACQFKMRVESLEPEFACFNRLETLQVNLGNMCNQHCQHCHMDAGPGGSKVMRKDIMEKIINFLRGKKDITLDITGGCPELNPDFKYLVEETCRLTRRLIVRTNLSIMLEKEMEWIPQWYKDHHVALIASMPCYTKENVDKQRGDGVFEKSIEALQKLDRLGYGDFLELNLVYNPGGEFLPSPQKDLEADYKKQLYQGYGIRFHNLFTITNAPLGRFRNHLKATGQLERYMQLLEDNFNPVAAENIMCRTLISVDWQGTLYNCDFNQAAGLPIRDKTGEPLEIDNIQDAIQVGREIVVDEHCYCCTAGAGSSCTGALVY